MAKMWRELAEAAWLALYFENRSRLSAFGHLQIPVGETRAECLALLLRNPHYPFHG